MTFNAWLIFLMAALLEVGGDAAVRRGLRGGGWIFILTGFVVLGTYGLVVNAPKTWISPSCWACTWPCLLW